MELWKYEWKKLWKNKIICGLLFGCVFLTQFFFTDRQKAMMQIKDVFPKQ